MTQEEIIKKSEEVFTFLYKGCVRSDFRFPKGYGAKILQDFSKSILKRESGLVSLGLIVDFCIHQVNLWKDADRWKHFSIAWAFSEKAIERFYTSKPGVRYYQDLWLQENDLSRDELKYKFISFKEHPLKKFIYIPAEDSTKTKMLNKEAGLAFCSALTSLYTPQSPVCQSCNFKMKCEEALKKRDPELHRLRMLK